MVGSLMIYHARDLASAWNRIKTDVYWTAGVWDKSKARVEAFVDVPNGWLRYPAED
jgi:hypothetical protein